MVATISTAVTILKFIKKNWHWIVIGLMVISFGITISVMGIKLKNRDRKIEKLNIENEKLAATNTLLLKQIIVDDKIFIMGTNYDSSKISISNIIDYDLSNYVIDSVNEIIKNFDYDYNSNTMGGTK